MLHPPPPHTIHPPCIRSSIFGKCVILYQRFWIHFINIVSLLHGITQSSLDCLCCRTCSLLKLPRMDGLVVKMAECRTRTPIYYLKNLCHWHLALEVAALRVE